MAKTDHKALLYLVSNLDSTWHRLKLSFQIIRQFLSLKIALSLSLSHSPISSICGTHTHTRVLGCLSKVTVRPCLPVTWEIYIHIYILYIIFFLLGNKANATCALGQTNDPPSHLSPLCYISFDGASFFSNV